MQSDSALPHIPVALPTILVSYNYNLVFSLMFHCKIMLFKISLFSYETQHLLVESMQKSAK